MQITLIQSPDDSVPPSQVECYQVLEALKPSTTLEMLRVQMNLRSILPVQSRLNHLAERGLIKIA